MLPDLAPVIDLHTVALVVAGYLGIGLLGLLGGMLLPVWNGQPIFTPSDGSGVGLVFGVVLVVLMPLMVATASLLILHACWSRWQHGFWMSPTRGPYAHMSKTNQNHGPLPCITFSLHSAHIPSSADPVELPDWLLRKLDKQLRR